MPDLTIAELARRYGVSRSTVSRAVARSTSLHASDPDRYAAPPEPVNPGEPQLRFPSGDMDEWWPRRQTAPGPLPGSRRLAG